MDQATVYDALLRVRALLENGQVDDAIEVVKSLLPADQADVFQELQSAERDALLPSLDAEDAANILEQMDDVVVSHVVSQLGPTELASILDEMEPDEAADLLGDLDPAVSEAAMAQMEDEAEADVRSLLLYADESAGGLMTSDYYVFPQHTSVGKVFRAIREQPPRDEEIPYVYAVDSQGRLTGIAELADLIRAHAEQSLSAIADPAFVSVTEHEDQETAARILNRYDLMAVPVLDDQGRLVGVITADDAMEAQEAEDSEDIYKGAGILALGGQEAARSDLLVRGPIWQAWLVRIPFLIVTLIGSMLAGAVIGVYKETLASVLVLALFIPVTMAMGGNAGTQSDEIFIRAHALGQIDLGQFTKHLLKEFVVGLGMGAIMGVLAGLIAAFWQGMPEIGLVVGLALAANMALATVLGFLIPFILIKVGMDPAAGASPLITTIKDITGILIYFLLATWFLGHLL